MKRLIPFCLSLLLLASAACLPTPTEEYVVSKADNVLEQKLNATPKPITMLSTTASQMFIFSRSAALQRTALS